MTTPLTPEEIAELREEFDGWDQALRWLAIAADHARLSGLIQSLAETQKMPASDEIIHPITAERDALRAEVERLKDELEHWRSKAQCYGAIVHGCSPALEAAGYPVNDGANTGGAVAGVKVAVEALKAERDALRAEKARLETTNTALLHDVQNLCVNDNERVRELAAMRAQLSEAKASFHKLIDKIHRIMPCGHPLRYDDSLGNGGGEGCWLCVLIAANARIAKLEEVACNIRIYTTEHGTPRDAIETTERVLAALAALEEKP